MFHEALSHVSLNQTVVIGLKKEGHRMTYPSPWVMLLIHDSSVPCGQDVNLSHVVPRSCLLPGFFTVKLLFFSFLENWASESSLHSRVRELSSASQERGIKVGTAIKSTAAIRGSKKTLWGCILCLCNHFILFLSIGQWILPTANLQEKENTFQLETPHYPLFEEACNVNKLLWNQPLYCINHNQIYTL